MFNRRFGSLSILISLYLLHACGSSSNSSNMAVPDAPSDYTSLSLSMSIDSVQPMTGIAFWSTNLKALNALGEDVQLEFSYLAYSDIVQQEGVYNWQLVEDLLNQIANRKRQAILRFRYTYPGQTAVSVPEYIVNNGDYQVMIDRVEGQDTFLPDWRSPALSEFTLAFYQAFAERYNGDPRIAMLQVGFGSYAEYHLYDGPVSLGVNFPSKAFQADFINAMDRDFTVTQWSISIDASSSAYTPFESSRGLKEARFGVFDDSFMHQHHSSSNTEYNRSSWLFFGEDKYESNMMGGEFSYYSDYDQQNVLSLPDGPWGRSFESFMAQYPLSYINGNDQFRYQSASRIKQASMAMGYKFVIDAFETSSNSSRVTVSNRGNAPIYYDAYVTINDMRSSQTLKGLLPGQSAVFVIPSGGTQPTLTIESDHLVDGQAIQFSADL